MFTGIIEHQARVIQLTPQPNFMVISIDMGKMAKAVNLGDSVAINGACLTAVKKAKTVVSFDVMRETLAKTALKHLKVGQMVNVELALLPTTRLGGHFVTGHVDEVSRLKAIEYDKNWVAMTFTVSKQQQRYLVNKGSIAIDGVSLTVGKVHRGSFEVYLIPFTLTRTHFGKLKVGDEVNLETDILAKYVKS